MKRVLFALVLLFSLGISAAAKDEHMASRAVVATTKTASYPFRHPVKTTEAVAKAFWKAFKTVV